MLKIELRVGESIRIGDATVTLEEKSGKIARFSVDADKSIPIQRVQATGMAQIAKNGIGVMPVRA